MQYSKTELENILSTLILARLEENKTNDNKVAGIISIIKNNRLLIEKILDDSFTSTSRLRTSELIYGVGVVDVQITNENRKAYESWRHMLRRSYSPEYKNRKPTYENCTVADEWLVFSEYQKFYEANYKEGYQLDKDILVEGNKIYSKETCCFVPTALNGLIVNIEGIGVNYDKQKNKFRAGMSIKGKQKNLGYYSTEEDAIKAYRTAKKKYVNDVVDEYALKGEISDEIVNALKSRVVDW